MPRMALRRNSAWFDVQAKVIVKSTALKPENHVALKAGLRSSRNVVKMPSFA